MAATVKRDGIRKRRFPQSSTKHALASPYHLQWPAIKGGGAPVIINEIVRALEPLQFEQLCTRSSKASKQKEIAKKKELRSSLLLGLSNVTKALEKGTLRLVLVDRSIEPHTLLEHLLVLCATRKAPACAITGMSESRVPRVLGVRKLAAFAFKNTDIPTIYDGLVDFIMMRIEPLYVPWLHSNREHGDTPASMNTGINSGGDDSDEEHLPGIQKIGNKRRRFKHVQNKDISKQLQLTFLQDGIDSTVDSHAVKSDIASLQGAGDSGANLPGTNGDEVNLPGRSVSNVNLPDTNETTVHIPHTHNSAQNLSCSGNYAVNLSETYIDNNTESQDAGNDARNSQGNSKNAQRSDDANLDKASGKKRRRRRRRRSEPDQPSLVYLRPFVKSFDVEKDKQSK